MKEDLERAVKKFVSILLCLSFLLPVAAQNDSVSIVSDTVSVVEELARGTRAMARQI